jgi:arsenate reductase
MKQKVLFICTHNSARSQIAEGLLNSLHSDQYEGYSAGIEATKVNPHVIKVMSEIGIDISHQRSKTIEEFHGETFDYVITVCDHTKEVCPFFPGKTILHKGFDNPLSFTGTEEEILNQVRRVRDEIKNWIAGTFRVETHLEET